jgi:hypothetical protein
MRQSSAPDLIRMLDGFPLSAEDTDYTIQVLIQGDVGERRVLHEEHEEAVQSDREHARASGRLIYRAYPTHTQRYPSLHKGNANEWLMPLLRRLKWNLSRGEAGSESLAGFAKAKWKTKENRQCAAQAEVAFSYVLAERAPKTALPVLESGV